MTIYNEHHNKALDVVKLSGYVAKKACVAFRDGSRIEGIVEALSLALGYSGSIDSPDPYISAYVHISVNSKSQCHRYDEIVSITLAEGAV